MANIYYVYVYKHPITLEPIYVGKGKNNRAYQHLSNAKSSRDFSRNYLINGLRKLMQEHHLEPIIEFAATELREDAAHELEKILISQYGRRQYEANGTLYNLTLGGEGCSGKPTVHSEETRRKMSLIQKESARIRKQKGIEFRHSDEHKEKLRRHNPGGEATAKPIWQISMTGVLMKLWPSTTQAASSLNLKKGHISNCASSRLKSGTAGGFYWRYPDADDIASGNLVGVEEYNARREKPKNVRSVVQKSIDGTVIKIWDSQVKAAEAVGLKKSAPISVAMKTGGMSAGFYWERAI